MIIDQPIFPIDLPKNPLGLLARDVCTPDAVPVICQQCQSTEAKHPVLSMLVIVHVHRF